MASKLERRLEAAREARSVALFLEGAAGAMADADPEVFPTHAGIAGLIQRQLKKLNAALDKLESVDGR